MPYGVLKRRTWQSYRSMNARCYDRSHPHFNHYGGRGITVCKRWRISFHNFIADMGRRPANKVLDRRNNSKGYSRNNCRWVTKKTSTQNRRNTVWIRFDGKRMRVNQFAKLVGITPLKVYRRTYAGWSVDRIAKTK